MSIIDVDIVDFASMPPGRAEVILTIADHLEWIDVHEHLACLQRKVSRYLDFIESGEIEVAYPHAVGRPRRIDIAFKHPPPPEVIDGALVRATNEVGRYGVRLTWSVFEAASLPQPDESRSTQPRADAFAHGSAAEAFSGPRVTPSGASTPVACDSTLRPRGIELWLSPFIIALFLLVLGGVYWLPASLVSRGRDALLTGLLGFGLTATVSLVGVLSGLSLPRLALAVAAAWALLLSRRAFGPLDSLDRFAPVHILTLLGALAFSDLSAA